MKEADLRMKSVRDETRGRVDAAEKKVKDTEKEARSERAQR